jgi:hypothetical protein
MVKESIPKHLDSTYILLKTAFPTGISEEEYYPVLALLYDFMSDRNLSEVISYCTGKDEQLILNDIYAVQGMKLENENYMATKQLLIKAGYKEWTEED